MSYRMILTFGDGAMQMNGNGELVTVMKYWQEWRDPRFIVMVMNNRDLNQVTWEQRALAGDPKFEASQNIPDFPYARYAELIGLKGIRVDVPEALGKAWDEALASDRPTVLEAYTDPDVPPLPPHIRFDQARAYMSALFKGEPDAMGIIKASAKEFMDQLLPPEPRKD